MNKVLGIIFSYTDHDNLKEITRNRTFASIPFAGRYRLIDFMLSNYVNSNIHDVFVLTKKNYHSMMDHLESGAEWDLTRKRGGLKILTPTASANKRHESDLGDGKIADLNDHMVSIRRSQAQYVVISGTSMIYSANYKELIDFHIEKDADITAMYTTPYEGIHCNASEIVSFDLYEDGRVKDIVVNAQDKMLTDEKIAMKVYVIKKSLLETLITDAVAYGRFDFERDILQRLCGSLKIYGYEFKKYYIKINSINSYMKAHMSLLKKEIREQVFENTVYTKTRDSVPAYYGANSSVKNSIISDGCKIEGTVENCVLSRGVFIGKGAVVKNSIIMQDVKVMSNAQLEYSILDKEVMVGENRRLSGHETYPVVIEKRSMV